MTYKDIKGLEKHRDLYKYFKTIEHGLDEYQKKIQKGKNNIWLLKSSVSFFFEILDTIVGEFLYEFPECEVRSEAGRLVMPTVVKLEEKGQVRIEIYELFNNLYRYGTIANLQDGAEERLNLSDILNVYDKLLAYMPEFLHQFPKSHKHSGKVWIRGRIGMTVTVVTVGTILLVAVSLSHAAKNKIDNLEVQLSDAEELLASVSAENEDLKKELKDASQKEREEEAETESVENITEEPVEEAADEKEEEAAEKTEDKSVEATEEAGKVEAEEEPEVEVGEDGHHYAMGETWVVEGQWEFTIDGISATPYYANDGSDEIVIDYHYKNLGYENSSVGGLNMSLASLMSTTSTTIIDSDGIVATPYTMATGLVYPQTATVGASWSAQAKFHILSPVKSATLEYTQRDGSGKEQSATFDLKW